MNFSRFFHIAALGLSLFSSEILSATSHEDDLSLRKNAPKAFFLANDATLFKDNETSIAQLDQVSATGGVRWNRIIRAVAIVTTAYLVLELAQSIGPTMSASAQACGARENVMWECLNDLARCLRDDWNFAPCGRALSECLARAK